MLVGNGVWGGSTFYTISKINSTLPEYQLMMVKSFKEIGLLLKHCIPWGNLLATYGPPIPKIVPFSPYYALCQIQYPREPPKQTEQSALALSAPFTHTSSKCSSASNLQSQSECSMQQTEKKAA